MKANEKISVRQRVLRELLSWAGVVAAFLFIQGTLVQARVIPSGSMERTLLIGDHLLISRIGYDAELAFTGWHVRLWREPRRQQVVVFRAPIPGSPDYVKRVIGLPGDLVEIRQGAVWLNGRPLPEPYRNGAPVPSDQFGPVRVPAQSYFVLGDNRENSYDSRYWGFVPRTAIVGVPFVLYMSIEAPGETWQPGHIGERVSAYLHALADPHLVRWRRLFVTF